MYSLVWTGLNLHYTNRHKQWQWMHLLDFVGSVCYRSVTVAFGWQLSRLSMFTQHLLGCGMSEKQRTVVIISVGRHLWMPWDLKYVYTTTMYKKQNVFSLRYSKDLHKDDNTLKTIPIHRDNTAFCILYRNNSCIIFKNLHFESVFKSWLFHVKEQPKCIKKFLVFSWKLCSVNYPLGYTKIS